MSALLSFEHVESGYGQSQVLFGMDFELRAGQVTTLLGRNGMGKTTTLKVLFNLLPAWRGEIRFRGERINGRSTERIAQMGIALVPEGRQIFPNLTVRENLTAFAGNRSGSADPWNLDRIHALFPRLKERSDNMGNELSGGEQQMLAIGRALMTNPHLLILDEATEGISPLIRREIWNVLARLKAAGQTILVIDKYLKEIQRVADYHVFIEKGHVPWTGDNARLAAQPDLWERYLGV
ncbi:branched-chain amino acid transport system ATP-binding protein [Ralstonia sp. 151470066-2]|jgi:branched-chain amino acid transport system ATP-binding protein|uniref:ABC transporter ATP-binding protein n=1 Tax=Ralstonia sp. RRA TaxID=3122075 RepID=UPI000664BC13|nr:ABC transporter ATP-binding protein [Ralstonia sp. MD27]MBA9857170.1 ABC transporter ATP-binding protein [Ralstonia insidiosa]NOZ14741.1 ABC transporter ATP-binding protein [Betaproteobacteria bacterium]MBA9870272.1 ABC transporter ATP-binding protein [Ralstonia insidiosa]MBA9913218.1 ABC transporter ATP-binding protein [Ralstonia insidiosa]